MPSSWLNETGSLTFRLRRICRERLIVRILRQGWARPFRGEAEKLGLAAGRRVLVREVVLQDGPTPLVFARTVIPPDVLRGPHYGLARLGCRPLGDVIFSSRGLCRGGLELCRVAAAEWAKPVGEIWDGEQAVWGRRSLYQLDRLNLLVEEFFLPVVIAASGDAK
jgi:chorismate--pyruvate lyase